ncbi:MAG: hypothetical protein E7595_05920 [Ruminococcaceae bacterium]|nr:hypothetical protein [Oscillospiraceae bacterium]
MKTINNEIILDTIYDLADSLGLRVDVFLDRVEEEFANVPLAYGLPEEIINELNEARDLKKEKRKRARMEADEEKMTTEISAFCELFPDVTPESIPDSVWEDVAGGATLVHAYALMLVREKALDSIADKVNLRNADLGAGVKNDGSTEPVFTKEQVEKMTSNDIKRNYKSIIRAMKSWKL